MSADTDFICSQVWLAASLAITDKWISAASLTLGALFLVLAMLRLIMKQGAA